MPTTTHSDRMFAGITVPDGKQVTVIVVGLDGGDTTYVHFDPLTADDLRKYEVWAGPTALRLDYRLGSKSDVQYYAAQRWPGVIVCDMQCTCCCPTDLVEINECGYCGLLVGHVEICPCHLPAHDPEFLNARLAAHHTWEAGYDAARAGAERPAESALAQLGYDWAQARPGN